MAANDLMNSLMRKGGRGLNTGMIPVDSSAKGSQDFTVQPPGTHSPTDQFIYEPLDSTPGAWAVYPPGVPCDTSTARISRASPADAGDFAAMQDALDQDSEGPGENSTDPAESGEGEMDTGDSGMGGKGA